MGFPQKSNNILVAFIDREIFLYFSFSAWIMRNDSMSLNFLKDRFTRGFISGVAGWPPEITFISTMYKLHLTKLRYLDFAALLTFNHKPQGWAEIVLAEVVVLIFLGVLGIGFSMLLKVISSKNIYFKGWLYGTFMWFAIYAVMTMYKLEHIYPVDTKTALYSLISASIWSIGMTWTYGFLNRKFEKEN
jgi:hypothetical protein